MELAGLKNKEQELLGGRVEHNKLVRADEGGICGELLILGNKLERLLLKELMHPGQLHLIFCKILKASLKVEDLLLLGIAEHW